MATVYDYLADAVVVVHATYIAVVIFGLLAILLGALLRWEWVRNFWFRLIHFLMILVVVVQALANVDCPLTLLEKHWRDMGGETIYAGSFVGHWVHELIFFEAPDWVFTVCYCAFGAIVLATFFLVPPHPPRRRLRSEEGTPPGGPPDAN
jgi:hypothetical protein